MPNGSASTTPPIHPERVTSDKTNLNVEVALARRVVSLCVGGMPKDFKRRHLFRITQNGHISDVCPIYSKRGNVAMIDDG